MNTGEEIKLLQKGQTPSLLDAEKGNELIEAINALQKIEIKRNGEKDFISYSSNNVLLNLQEMSGGGDLDGFVEFQSYFCVNGQAVRKTILVKEESS